MHERPCATFSKQGLPNCRRSRLIRPTHSRGMPCSNMCHSGPSNARGNQSLWCVKCWPVPVDGWMKCARRQHSAGRSLQARQQMMTKTRRRYERWRDFDHERRSGWRRRFEATFPVQCLLGSGRNKAFHATSMTGGRRSVVTVRIHRVTFVSIGSSGASRTMIMG